MSSFRFTLLMDRPFAPLKGRIPWAYTYYETLASKPSVVYVRDVTATPVLRIATAASNFTAAPQPSEVPAFAQIIDHMPIFDNSTISATVLSRTLRNAILSPCFSLLAFATLIILVFILVYRVAELSYFDIDGYTTEPIEEATPSTNTTSENKPRPVRELPFDADTETKLLAIATAACNYVAENSRQYWEAKFGTVSAELKVKKQELETSEKLVKLLRSQLTEKGEELTAAEVKLMEKEQETEDKDGALKEVQQELKITKDEHRQIQGEVDQKNGALTVKEDELKTMRGGLKEATQKLKVEHQKTEKSAKELKKKTDELDDKNEEVKAKNEQIEKQIAEINELTKMKGGLKLKDGLLKKQGDELEKRDQELKAMDKALKKQNGELSALAKAKRELKAREDELMQQNQDLEKKDKQLREKNDDIGKLMNMESEIIGMRDVIAEMKEELTSATAEVTTMQELLATTDALSVENAEVTSTAGSATLEEEIDHASNMSSEVTTSAQMAVSENYMTDAAAMSPPISTDPSTSCDFFDTAIGTAALTTVKLPKPTPTQTPTPTSSPAEGMQDTEPDCSAKTLDSATALSDSQSSAGAPATSSAAAFSTDFKHSHVLDANVPTLTRLPPNSTTR